MRRHHAILAALSGVAIAAVIAVGGVAVNERALERDLVQLPEHNGLAARYPKDEGLATDPTVVLADGFEGPRSLWTRTIVRRLFLRHYLKYDDTFPGAHHVGGMVSARAPGAPETAPGIRPDGTNRFDGMS